MDVDYVDIPDSIIIMYSSYRLLFLIIYTHSNFASTCVMMWRRFGASEATDD
jgi:hypothetical protein